MTTLITGAQSSLGLAFARAVLATGAPVITAVSHGRVVPPALRDLHDEFPSLCTVVQWAPDALPTLPTVTDAIIAELPLPPAPLDESLDPLADLTTLDLQGALRASHALLAPTLAALRWIGGVRPSRLMIQGSWLGSIHARVRGGNYDAGLSYAAHLMLLRVAALDLQRAGIGVVIGNAGRFRTDLAGPAFQADIDEVAMGLLRQLETASPADEPRFVDWRGAAVPW